MVIAVGRLGDEVSFYCEGTEQEQTTRCEFDSSTQTTQFSEVSCEVGFCNFSSIPNSTTQGFAIRIGETREVLWNRGTLYP